MRYILFLLILTVIPLNIISMQSSAIQEKKADTWGNRFYRAWLVLSGQDIKLKSPQEIADLIKKREEYVKKQGQLFDNEFISRINKWIDKKELKSGEEAVYVKGLKIPQEKRVKSETVQGYPVRFTLEPSPSVYLFSAIVGP